MKKANLETSKGNEHGDRCHTIEQNHCVRKLCVNLLMASPMLSPLHVVLYAICDIYDNNSNNMLCIK